jgi:hypothetical protein
VIALRRCVMSLAVLSALAATAPDSRAQDFPQVREVRAHRSNYSARSSRSIRRIVIHTSEGSESSCVNTFLNPRSRVSSHYLVSHQGRITRLVPDMSVAYHARDHNSDSIGIENEGYAYRAGWTDAQYRSLAALVRGLCNRYRIPKDRHSIVGHDQVSSRGKVDPGPYFDWTRFLALVRGGSSAGAGGFTTVLGGVGDHGPAGGHAYEICTVSALRVRSGPSTSSTILGQLSRGQKVRRLERRGPWALIEYGQRRAWVHTAFTRPAS